MRARDAFAAFCVVVFGEALAIGCAYYEDRAADRITEVGGMLAPVDERVIHGDTQFSPWERSAAERGVFQWQVFTRGRVHLSIRWDLDDTNYMTLPAPLLYRVNPTPETGNMGGRTEGDRIWWVPQTCPDLEACIMHEIGHMLGLHHVAYAREVMSASNPAHQFGIDDYAECLRVGACRGPKIADVTTVTVTVDPNMPNPSLEYPPP